MFTRVLAASLFAVTAVSAACSGPTSGDSKKRDDDSRSSAASTTSAEASGSGASRSGAAAPSSASVALSEPGPATEIPDDATPPLSPSGSASASGKPPSGSASISSIGTSGGTVSNASSVVAGMAAGFRRCYNRALQENPNIAGSMKVRAKIGPNGEVLAAEPTEVKGLPGGLTSCVAMRVSSAQFAPPTGGAATVVIPVAFSSN